MKKTTIITGLDIGSSKIAAVVAEIDRDGSCEIRTTAHLPSRGISKGAVVNLDEAIASVSNVLFRINNKLSRRAENIYVNISGKTICAEKSRGMIPLSIRGREITEGDMARCVNVASTIQLPFERDIIHRIVQSFSVDDQMPIKHPTGLYGSRLACEMYVITADINQIQNIYKCVNSAGYVVKEIVFTGLADSLAVLTDDERENGALLLDIGASLTELSLYFKNVLTDLDVILAGSEDIQGDYKNCAAFNGIISRAKSKLEGFQARGMKIASVTLTGGITFRDEIVELLEEGLALPVRIGIVKGLKGDLSSIDSVRATTAIGLLRYGLEKYRTRALQAKNLFERISTSVVDIFNNYF